MLLPIFTSVWGGERLCWFSELLLAHPAPTCPDSPSMVGDAHQATTPQPFHLPLPFPTPKPLSHMTYPYSHQSSPPSVWLWLHPVQPSRGLLPPGTSQHLAGPYISGLSFCSVECKARGNRAHRQNPSTVNWKCKLEAIALSTGTHVVLAFISGLPPSELNILSPSPSVTLVPCLWFLPSYLIFTINPSKNRLPKNLLRTPLKSTYYSSRVGSEIEKKILNNTKILWKILTCTQYLIFILVHAFCVFSLTLLAINTMCHIKPNCCVCAGTGLCFSGANLLTFSRPLE